MIEIERGVDLLGEARTRIVAHALVLLFENDAPLRQDDVVGELKPGHAISLELHDRLELFARNTLKVTGVILRRKRVLLPSDAGDDLREFPGGILRSPLEHQVLEKMRQT